MHDLTAAAACGCFAVPEDGSLLCGMRGRHVCGLIKLPSLNPLLTHATAPMPRTPQPQQLFSMPTTGKLLAVLAIALPVVLAASALYKRAMGCTWGEVSAGRRLALVER